MFIFIFEEIPLLRIGFQPALNPQLGPMRGSSGRELACSRDTGILRVPCADRLEMKNPPRAKAVAGSGGMGPRYLVGWAASSCARRTKCLR